MIFRLLFVIMLCALLKVFIRRFDFKDYFNVSIFFLFILVSLLYLTSNDRIYVFLMIIFCLILIIYSIYFVSDSDSSIIVIDGSINFKNLIRNKYSLSKLLHDLKSKKIFNLNKNLCGILQDGNLVFYYKSIDKKFVPIIIDGTLEENNLFNLKKDFTWLYKTLKRNNCSIDKTFLAFYYNSIFYIIKK